MRAGKACSAMCIGFLLSVACAYHRTPAPIETSNRTEQTRIIASDVRELGVDGDWLAIRGYKPSDDLVSYVTGMPLSHVGILDKSRMMVIEAEGEGVHATPLESFITKASRIILIRPNWTAHGKEAVERARALVGTPYDFWGTLGLDDPDKYYCTELVLAAYKPFLGPEDRLPVVPKPGALYEWGRILYDSGARP